jgi:GT2 family glycosyltransferase
MPMKPVSLSVVIVSWNAKAYLEECLQSLAEDVYDGPMEIVVVDNASSDGSADMVKRQFPAVTLIRNAANLGFSKANNIGIRRCTGDYIALVNSDIHVLKGCLSELVAFSESQADVGVVGPKIIGRDGKRQVSHKGFPRLWNSLCRALALDVLLPRMALFNGYLKWHEAPDGVTPVDILSGCFLVAKRRAIDQVGLLDERFFIYGEDMDWCKRFWQGGWKAMFVPEARAIHYGGASSANAPLRFAVEMQRADCQYWAKHHTDWASSTYVAISMLDHSTRWAGHGLAAILRSGTPSASHRHRAACAAACLRWLVFERGTAAAPPGGVAIKTNESSSPP